MFPDTRHTEQLVTSDLSRVWEEVYRAGVAQGQRGDQVTALFRRRSRAAQAQPRKQEVNAHPQIHGDEKAPVEKNLKPQTRS